MRSWKTRIIRLLAALLCGLCAAVVQASPESGWWWNPDEAGRGFFVESHDGLTFIGGYLYDADGHASWLVSAGPNPDPYNFSGELYNLTNGQTLFGAYMPPGKPVVVGQLSAHFSDDTHATITWPGSMVQIERETFGSGLPVFKPYTGWWWNPDESGSGYSVEVQGNNLFIVAFTYDNTGRPVWYFSAGPMSSETTYHGDVLQFANGQTMGGPYQPPGTPAKVATLDVNFTDVTTATLTFTQAAASAERAGEAKAAPQRTTNIQPELGTKPATYTLPDSFTGTFKIDAQSHEKTPDGRIDADFTITIEEAVFRQDPTNKNGRYALKSGKVSFSYYEVDGVSNGTCIGTKQPTLSLTDKVFVTLDKVVGANGDPERPEVTLKLPEPATIPFVSDVTCTISGMTFGGITKTIYPQYREVISDNPEDTLRVVNNYILSSGTKHDPLSDGTLDTTYSVNLKPDR